ncbi:MAG TPA: thioredoxin domain-containing protein [Actinomycetota bacterium]|nr:thioredoxin domain-containing protein [Actinomycetota bacterium]
MPNRLAEATSPYLLQHADNPVDWYEWGEEAFRKAETEDKPILLSVGYAACHWCHVMAHESFEDPDVAAVMNEHFVCVKVDREERPDVDAIYMDAVQTMSGQGGWPMTVFLTPNREPFFAGTYFPPEDRHGLPGFRRVLEGLAQAWRERREEVLTQGRQIVEALGRNSAFRASSDPLDEGILRQAHGAMHQTFDPDWGGFGMAPKFPQPMTVEFLLRTHLRGYHDSLDMVMVTLDRMAAGGIRDHLGGGFHRYSTDRLWLVPHFEKMLYDNAQLARLYAHAWQVTGNDTYRTVATETLEYLLREIRHRDGGFFSAQDADSEGVEGKFFVWSYEELAKEAGVAVAAYFGAVPEGNWEETNILWTPRPMEDVATDAGVSGDELRAAVDNARPKLLRLREQRIKPATDDKVLASWNGLAISALAECGRVFGERRFVDAAVGAADFVLSALRRQDGRLLRAWRDGRTSGPAYADDHALMAAACLDLYETTFDVRWFTEARTLADDLIRLFHDRDNGGFFQTGSDAEALVIRPKELFDNAVPSGNSVAAEVLQRLALLTGEAEYERAGVSALRLVRDLLGRAPTGFGHALGALDLYLSPAKEIAIVGEPDGEATRALVDEVWKRYLPNAVLAVAAPGDDVSAKTVPLLEGRDALDSDPAAYVCERFVCQRPVSEPEALAAQLD